MDSLDARGRTALWWACQRGDLPSAKVLLDFGANPNLPDIEGFSPFLALLSTDYPLKDSDRLDVIMLLIQHGANTDHCMRQGWKAIYLASIYDDTQVLEPLLSRWSSININAQDYKRKHL